MWDVIWTDPSKELVGEHRAKKVQTKEKERSSLRSGRDSSATSGSSSSSDGAFSFFRSRRVKNAVAPRPSGNRSPSFSGLATPSLTSTLSPISQTFDSPSRRSSGMVTTAPNSPNQDGLDVFSSSVEQETHQSSNAGKTRSAAAKPPLPFSEAGISDSPSIAALIQLLDDLPSGSELADAQNCETNESDIVAKAASALPEAQSIDALIATFPKSPTKGAEVTDENPDIPESPILLIPPPKSPRRPVGNSLGINNVEAWRTPSRWRDDETSEVQKSFEPVDRETNANVETRTKSPAIANVTPSFLSSAGAPTGAILAKFKQALATKPEQELDQFFESPKQHWMLSLLHRLGYKADPEEKCETAASDSAPAMLLYETAVYASYIGIINHGTQVYHLTTENVSRNLENNIQTLQAPRFESSCFPVASHLFKEVHSFSLPANCPYNLLPNVLSNVNKCLRPGGSLKLTIIDPLPNALTCGERLRNWMETHLLPNLEKSARCLEPSRLFPKLLGDAGLRGTGSRRTVVKFFALSENASCGGKFHDPDQSINRMYQEYRERAELRTMFGRMFWMEVWGQHVTPSNTWWWDDPAIVEECWELGTFWEYQIIDAVKN